MKDSENLHKKVQELCDCYSTTDPLQEMSKLDAETEPLDAALKWLALATLHGVNSNAKKISIKQANDGSVSVTAEYRQSQLPQPDEGVAANIFEAVRKITHISDKKGKSMLALGIKDSSLDLSVSVKEKDDYKKVSIKF
jgi:hypothetical protein